MATGSGGPISGGAVDFRSSRLPFYVCLVPDALSGGLPIGRRITFGHRELLVFL